MFVSSYSTYISNNASDKTAKVTQQREKEERSSFSSKLLKEPTTYVNKLSNLPINYISANKALVNKQELDYQSANQKESVAKETKELTSKLTKQTSLSSLDSAYSANKTMFSFLQKPKITLHQTPRVDRRQDSATQEIQKENLRLTMVNTYLQNDKYYEITA